MFALRVRSFFSLSLGTASPARLCRLAKTLGYTGLAITDRDNLYGLWDFLRAARAEGLRPLIGAEVSEPDSPKIVTCLVQNASGYRNLCCLLSERKLAPSFSLAQTVVPYGDGLLLLCRDPALLDLYHKLGLQVAADLGNNPDSHSRRLRMLAAELGIPAVATCNSDLGDERDRPLSGLLQAIAKGLAIDAEEVCRHEKEVCGLFAPEEYGKRFAIWPEVAGAGEKLAAQCAFAGPGNRVVMPPWQSKDGRSSGEVLREKAYDGARHRYGEDLGEAAVERLEHELRVIEEMGFSSYFLVVRDIVHRRQNDGRRRKRRICGRGSGAASLVAYCLDITNVCPLKYNLYFARFLNPGRTDPPDIDIDFSWDERDEVLDDVLGEYGERAAMVCNHVYYQPRMAIREAAKAFGLPGREISQVSKKIPWLYRRDEAELGVRLRGLPVLQDQDFPPPWPTILALAEQLIGVPRHLSVHPGGVVITPAPIRHYVPVERAAKGVRIIQWEKDGTEEAGLVKIDLLGNRSLGVIRDTLATLRQREVLLDELHWQPENDRPTKMAVAEGRTMGCFYIESPAMRLLEQKAGTGEFEQLVIQSSIIRPAANEFVREYVRRLHGGAWQPLCPQLGHVLDETYGLMVYQEDVSRVAVALAGFSHVDADGLRKVMAKKDKLRRLHHYQEMFFAGCRERGVAVAVIEQVWAMMMSFDGYSFCKPHSASYARVSFQAAYLKTHYPAEFMAAVISNQGGYYSTFAYVSEAKRHGVRILPPDVQQSQLAWQGAGMTIRVGLQSVKGLSAGFLRRLITARDEKNFTDAGDFFCRTQPGDDETRALIHAGALDCLDPLRNRSRLLWQWAAYQRLCQQQRLAGLFAIKLPPSPPLASPDRQTMLQREFAVLGFLCAYHPLQFFHHPHLHLVKVKELAQRRGQKVRLVAWLLTGKLVSTRTGEVMEFLTFEDETGQVETTFFPRVYRACAHLLQSGRGYILFGLVEEDFGVLTLTVEKVEPISVKHFDFQNDGSVV